MEKQISLQVNVYFSRGARQDGGENGAWKVDRIEPVSQATSQSVTNSETIKVAGNLSLYASDCEAYAYNLNSAQPSLFVVFELGQQNAQPTEPFVTASPFEAEDYLESDSSIVERFDMPEQCTALVAQFLDFHYVDKPFVKRKRQIEDSNSQKFGKQPIFHDRVRQRDE